MRFARLALALAVSLDGLHASKSYSFDYLVELEGLYFAHIGVDDSLGRYPRPPGAIATDAEGNAYVASSAGGFSVWKLSPDGKRIIYRTQFLPGAAYAMAVDPRGVVYVTGRAAAPFRFTNRLNGIDAGVTGGAFLIRLEPDGQVGFATLLSRGPGDPTIGTDAGKGVAIDPAGNVYVAGETASGIPVTEGAAQPGRKTQTTPCRGLADSPGSPIPCADAFVMKFDAQGRLLYSTYLSGSELDGATAVAVDAQGNAYITGYTASTDFPVTAGAFQTQSKNRPAMYQTDVLYDVFVAKLSPDGRNLVYSTYIGGRQNDRADGIAVDRQGRAHVGGVSKSAEFPVEKKLSQGNFPSTVSLQPNPANDFVNGFVLALDAAGARIEFSSWFGDAFTFVRAIALDAEGAIYVSGYTSNKGFPAAAGPRTVHGKGNCLIARRPFPQRDLMALCTNGFLTKLRPEAAGLVYSTLIGGEQFDQGMAVAVAPDGSAFATGSNSQVLPVTHVVPGAGNGRSWYVAKMPPAPVQDSPFPEFGPRSVVNAASFAPALQAGSLYTVFGKNLLNRNGTFVAEGFPLPKEVWGTAITVNGRPAPILAAVRTPETEQITFQAPWAGEEEFTMTAVVNNNGRIAYQQSYQGGFALGGIFTWDNGRGVALHSRDWTLITPDSPAVPEETITVYATGLGSVAVARPQVLPYPVDGEPASSDPLRRCAFAWRLRAGPAVAETRFCGLAPGMVGVFQLNAILAADTPGGEQELLLERVDSAGPVTASPPVRISIGRPIE